MFILLSMQNFLIHSMILFHSFICQAYKDFMARQPSGRLGKPEEVANLAVFLASDEVRTVIYTMDTFNPFQSYSLTS